MSERKYKGSVWNRWDLHVHTPESVLHNEFGSDWDVYAQTLFRQAIDNEIKAIGITDYYFIDGYKKLKLDYLNEAKLRSLGFNQDEIGKILELLIFPNIEFRISKLVVGAQHDPRWNRKVNLHLILSDKIPIQKIEELLQTLTVQTLTSQGQPQSERLTRSTLEEIGNEVKRHQRQFKDHTPLKAGMLCVSIDHLELIKVLSERKHTFLGRYLIAVAADEDLSEVQWGSQGHMDRKNLIRSSHIIFSSNPNTAKFLLGEYHDSLNDYESEFERCKPCLWGSDAHGFERLFKPDQDRNTWIKSKICFEGIVQTVHEPKYRAKIQPNIPGYKTPYLVIDKVRFIDNSGLFSDEWIYLNDDLNVIIGGKSSGKSLLLYFIAKTLDRGQVSNKINANFQDYKEIEKHIDFEVSLNDGSLFKLSDGGSSISPITFLPQMYINRLAEINGKKDLYKLIFEILLQNQTAFHEYKKLESSKDSSTSEITRNLGDLFSKFKERAGCVLQIRELGHKSQINQEIERLQIKLAEVTHRSELSVSEKEKYSYLNNERDRLLSDDRIEISNITKIEEYTIGLKDVHSKTLLSLDGKLPDVVGNEDVNLNIESIYNDIKDKVNHLFLERIGELDGIVERLRLENLQTKAVLSSISEEINPLNSKVSSGKELEEVSQGLENEKQKLSIYEELEKSLTDLDSEIKSIEDVLHESYSQLYERYSIMLDFLNQNDLYSNENELRIESKVDYRYSDFSNSFTNLFDLRRSLSVVFGNDLFDGNEFKYEGISHFDCFKKIYYILIEKMKNNESIPLKAGSTMENVLAKIFEDNFYINHTINYKGDDISVMSPGKKGIVLMQLLLDISDSKCPILIDQPEDNLDNRTIFSELNEYIKKKKLERQIIIVTHNANLVVSTDADNVIVANQEGQVSNKENKSYKFEYCNGPLESTFVDLSKDGILYKFGIREHVCEILEGGEQAFRIRERKYGFN